MTEGEKINKTQRQCLVTREILPKSELLRFVRSPSGDVVFDINHKLPGKGMWVKADKEVLGKALKQNVFANKVKNTKLAEMQITDILKIIKQNILGLLSLANKANLVFFGQERIGTHIDRGEVYALVVATDAASNSKNKLQMHIKKEISTVDCLDMADMEGIFPNDKIAFLGLKSGKIIDNILEKSWIYSKLR